MRPRVRMLREPVEAILPLPSAGSPSLFTPRLHEGPSSMLPVRRKDPRKIYVEEIQKPYAERETSPKRKARVRMKREPLPGKVIIEHTTRGHPPFTPTQAQREQVETGIANGIYHKDLRKLILNPDTGRPIDKVTFKKVFQYEIKNGHNHQRLQTSVTAFQMAVGSDAVYDEDGDLLRPAQPPNLAALKWYEQSRFGLKEGTQLVLTGPDGKPLPREQQPSNINIGTQVIFVLPKNGFEGKDPKDITPTAAQIEYEASEAEFAEMEEEVG
jgi:hypothetical protein